MTGTKRSHPLRVLVVDDERNYTRRLALEFEEAGFAARTAYDGQEALDALESEVPDLIVLDVRMPNMDGIACLRNLHARLGDDTPPVILLTGDLTSRVDTASLVYPGSFVLGKPCSYATVIRTARRLLERTGRDQSSVRSAR